MSQSKFLFFAILFAGQTLIQHSVAQQLVLNTKDIQLLIEEWNIIHNGQVVSGFANVYADELLFYTERVSREKAIALKKELFEREPEFRQRISTDVTYSAYASGILKCDFTKEVKNNGAWETYPSYLLVTLENDSYKIVGESDYRTDNTLGYELNLGPELEVKRLVEKVDTAISAASQDSTLTNVPEARDTQSSEEVTVPRRFFFVLAGFILIGGLLVFIVESIRLKRQKRKASSVAEPLADINLTSGEDVSGENYFVESKEETPLSEADKQAGFESFVLTLFDPMFFSYRKRKANSFVTTDLAEEAVTDSLEFEFHDKRSVSARFAVQCLFVEDTGEQELKLFPGDTLVQNARFEEMNNMDLYYVIGRGGTPDNPLEIFLLPSRLVKYEFVIPEALKPFRKLGMFFYNSAAGRLQ